MTGTGTSEAQGRVANLVIAGVGKSGTSSMFAYLASHPDICGSSVKETHFFDPVLDGDPVPPLTEYARFWAHADGQRYRLEATPLYCLGGQAMVEAFEAHLPPGHRVLMLVRDPVERLAVNFAYMQSKLALPDVDTFDTYVERCLAGRPVGDDESGARHGSAWARSFYGDYLGPWIEHLGPRLRLIWFEDLARDPGACVDATLRWLGLDPTPVASQGHQVHNPTTVARSRVLQRVAMSVNARAGALLLDHPRMRHRVRSAYLRLNGVAHEDPVVSPRTRARLEAALLDSNRRLARLLADAGHERLPPWLEATLDGATTWEGR